MKMKQTWSLIKIFKMTRFSLINDKTSKAATVLHKPDWVALQTEETTTCDAASSFPRRLLTHAVRLFVREENRMRDLPPNCHSPLLLFATLVIPVARVSMVGGGIWSTLLTTLRLRKPQWSWSHLVFHHFYLIEFNNTEFYFLLLLLLALAGSIHRGL